MRRVIGLLAFIALQQIAAAQQRPLLTEDPRLIPARAIEIESGVGYANDAVFTISGFRGDHVQLLQSGLHFGLGERAEFQIMGVLRDYLKTSDGVWHQDFGDLSLSTKIKIVGESSKRPVISFRPTIILPNANQASGLGLNTNRFFASILAGKTFGRVFVFGNAGVGILDDPVRVAQQNDVFAGGVAALVTLTPRTRIALEINGFHNPRDNPSPGSETHGQVRGGVQFSAKGVRWDVGILGGVKEVDPKIGFTAGLTKRFDF